METPRVAWNAGPPSWLVRKEWDEKEAFTKVADRVKARYFPKGEIGVREAELEFVKTKEGRRQAKRLGLISGDRQTATMVATATQTATICKTCGERKTAVGRTECHGCRRARQREKS